MSQYNSTTNDLTVNYCNSILRLSFANELLNFRMLENLTRLINQAQHDSNVRVVAIDASALGDDVGEMGSIPATLAHREPKGQHGTGPIVEQQTIRALREFMKPTVALIDGPLNGLAIDISAVCDLRIASDKASVTDNRIAQGRVAATGITYVLPKLIGLSSAMRILLLGDTLDAKDALAVQFFHAVHDGNRFEEAVDELLDRIANMATRAWEIHKKQVLPQLDQDFNTAMVHSLGIRQTHVIEDRIEGINAWRERRKPQFKGR